MSDRGRVKGATIRASLEWYITRFGTARIAGCVEGLPGELRSLVDPGAELLGILASQWYPAELLFAIIESGLLGLSPTQRASFAVTGAKLTTEHSISGVHRALFRAFATPRLYARFAQRLWNAHYDSGAYVAREVGPGAHEIEISSWRSHHEDLCVSIIGSSGAIYEAMGQKGVKTKRLSCVSEGADACRFRVDFRA